MYSFALRIYLIGEQRVEIYSDFRTENTHTPERAFTGVSARGILLIRFSMPHCHLGRVIRKLTVSNR